MWIGLYNATTQLYYRFVRGFINMRDIHVRVTLILQKYTICEVWFGEIWQLRLRHRHENFRRSIEIHGEFKKNKLKWNHLMKFDLFYAGP